MNPITKSKAKLALGIITDVAFADWFLDRPTKQAVSQWADDEPLPDARQWELRARCPDIFGPPAKADQVRGGWEWLVSARSGR